MTPRCDDVDAVVDEVVAGAPWPDDLATHVEACPICQGRVALARRIEHVLSTWPSPVPPPGFAARVAAVARRDAWAQEVVIDWGFNLAVAGCVALILGGAVAGVWMISAAAPMAESTRVATDILAAAVERARGQATIGVTAMALLLTALGGWWWAEQPQSE